MVVGIKDAAKLTGISIMMCCAVLVCTMFLNFYFDVLQIEDMISSDTAMTFYNAQVSTAKVVCLVSGGCLLITSVVMLIFYIGYYTDNHGSELGILKALGYSKMKIAKSFGVFGLSVFIGAAVGYAGAFLIMPAFYELQNKDKVLPEITINFHPIIPVCFIILPTVAFACLAIFCAYFKLNKPALMLLKNDYRSELGHKAFSEKAGGKKDDKYSFVEGLKRNTLRDRKILVFFIIFASFCFSSMTQMSAGMKDLSSEMMGVMILVIGVILACTTFVLAITTVINGNTKAIAIMRVFGWSQQECCRALLGGYRSVSYIGFALGTIYQYVLLRVMVNIVFKDIEGIPVYQFDYSAMFISLGFFVIFYEIVMYMYSVKIRKMPIKEIFSA